MVSTTWVQFIKGSLLVVFSAVLVVLILYRGFEAKPGEIAQTVATRDGQTLVNGLPRGTAAGQADLRPVGRVARLPGNVARTGPVGPLEFFRVLQDSEVVLWKTATAGGSGEQTTTYSPVITPGRDILRPGSHPVFKGIRSDNPLEKLNFLSLMLALFCGTASLPHILIRYYTVKDQAAARKSTIVGIGTIGFFYVLTLYLGLGAMTSGALDVTNSNMAAPLLARSFGPWLFAIISAIAFTTVLGTVSGLIIAASGAVVHDLLGSVLKVKMTDRGEVGIARVGGRGGRSDRHRARHPVRKDERQLSGRLGF